MTEINRLKKERETVEADCEDSGHFSIEGRTREWLLEQGRRSVCRSCGEGRTYDKRGSTCDTQFFRHEEIDREKDCFHKKTEKERGNLLSKKCSCGKCNTK